MKKHIKTSRISPEQFPDAQYRFETFEAGVTDPKKKNGRLPAMGWNSWNAFGSQNTEELTRAMADKMIELGLDKLGYEYLVLDDGCYHPERVDGKLEHEKVKFPSGFRVLSDYVHQKGLKFGMYNDIGTNLCAGSAVGTCGYEDVDARSYIDWGVDFLKVDNCYYLWDNASFSNAENARYSYAPNIRSIRITVDGEEKVFDAVSDGVLVGRRAKKEESYVTYIGTFDGTNVGNTPVGVQIGELVFEIEAAMAGTYEMVVEYATGKEEGVGEWLQVAVGEMEEADRCFDDLLPATAAPNVFALSAPISLNLKKGKNVIRLMNHRRQENVLLSYSALFNALQEIAPDNDIVLSICEWGKTQPHNWGYKIGNSWRILNDITFQVGAPGDPGNGAWTDPGTPSITSQYDKAVVMDEYAGLNKGWNDPDMLVIGMNHVTATMSKTQMAMWCMMNSPLMLGMDLRRVEKGDEIWQIIANKNLIALNQDPLGIQAKRVYCSLEDEAPDQEYITNHDRVDILAKPLANGDLALCFINLSEEPVGRQEISLERIRKFVGKKMVSEAAFASASEYTVTDLWTEETIWNTTGIFSIDGLEGCANHTVRISPLV